MCKRYIDSLVHNAIQENLFSLTVSQRKKKGENYCVTNSILMPRIPAILNWYSFCWTIRLITGRWSGKCKRIRWFGKLVFTSSLPLHYRWEPALPYAAVIFQAMITLINHVGQDIFMSYVTHTYKQFLPCLSNGFKFKLSESRRDLENWRRGAQTNQVPKS